MPRENSPMLQLTRGRVHLFEATLETVPDAMAEPPRGTRIAGDCDGVIGLGAQQLALFAALAVSVSGINRRGWESL